MHAIAQLATGDELIQGDLQNTNSQAIADTLHQLGFSLGQQMIVADNKTAIITALHYLLTDHDIVITIGGLGPTSDDLTRFAISEALQQPLQLDDTSWQMIQQRITRLGYQVTENNKQQALFPAGAKILLNDNGTANACYCEWQGKLIFMLPGPPNECLPLLHQHVIPRLELHCERQIIHRKHWYLFRVSESIVADQVTALLKDNACDVGYRVHYPYLQLKLASDNPQVLADAALRLQPLIQQYIIDDGSQFASVMLQQQKPSLKIFDVATRGHLQATLTTPETYQYVNFTTDKNAADVVITGFESYWNQTNVTEHTLVVTVKNHPHELVIPHRKYTTMFAVIEQICALLLTPLVKKLL